MTPTAFAVARMSAPRSDSSRPEHHQHLQREQRQEHVGVDVGDDARARHGGMRGEVARAEQPFLLAGHRDEQDRPRRLRARLVQRRRDLEDRRDARRVVHRAVVDRVAVDRAADAEMIEVRRHDDELVAPLRIRAAQDAGDVLRLDLRPLDRRRRLEARRQREARHRLVAVDEREHLGEGVAGSGEQLVGVRRVHRDRQLLARRIVERRRRRATSPAAAARASSAPTGCPCSSGWRC